MKLVEVIVQVEDVPTVLVELLNSWKISPLGVKNTAGIKVAANASSLMKVEEMPTP